MFVEGVLYLKRKITSWLPEGICDYYKKVMEMPDSPKKIARGVALGLAFDFLPIPVTAAVPLCASRNAKRQWPGKAFAQQGAGPELTPCFRCP